jgi:phosphotransferase system enzyme I (PtsP)
MVPMASDASEIIAARQLIDKELDFAQRRALPVPSRFRFGIMIEVPALLFDLDRILPLVDFISVGSNDLMQHLYAADRGNPNVSTRYDPLSAPFLRVLAVLVAAARRHAVDVTLCGEIGGRPLEAMALIATGFRSLSMSPASIGPIKEMIMSLDAGRATSHLAELLARTDDISVREELRRFAENEAIDL